MNCEREGCLKEAIRAPRWKIWANRAVFGNHPPIMAFIKLPLCGEHEFPFEQEKEQFYKMACDIAYKLRRARPDFHTMKFDYGTIADMEAFFQQANAGNN